MEQRSRHARTEAQMTLTLSSPAFADGETIPVKHSRDGENLSPPLRWTGAPDQVRSFLLIMEDPDAPSGTFRHFGVANIPPDTDRLPQSVDTAPERSEEHTSELQSRENLVC